MTLASDIAEYLVSGRGVAPEKGGSASRRARGVTQTAESVPVELLFQMGTVLFSRSSARHRQAANASARCGAVASTATDASPIARCRRGAAMTRICGQRCASTARGRPLGLGHRPYASYSDPVVARPSFSCAHDADEDADSAVGGSGALEQERGGVEPGSVRYTRARGSVSRPATGEEGQARRRLGERGGRPGRTRGSTAAGGLRKRGEMRHFADEGGPDVAHGRAPSATSPPLSSRPLSLPERTEG